MKKKHLETTTIGSSILQTWLQFILSGICTTTGHLTEPLIPVTDQRSYPGSWQFLLLTAETVVWHWNFSCLPVSRAMMGNKRKIRNNSLQGATAGCGLSSHSRTINKLTPNKKKQEAHGASGPQPVHFTARAHGPWGGQTHRDGSRMRITRGWGREEWGVSWV